MIHFKPNYRPRSVVSSSDGFTIVELMMALAVLAILLIISSLTLVTIGKLFSKNSNEINTQNTARSVMNDVASAIQLGSQPPVPISPVTPAKGTPSTPSSIGVLCVGNVRYVYIINGKLTSYSAANTFNHVLWRETLKTSGSCPVPAPGYLASNYPVDSSVVSNSGAELMPINMRLNDLSVTNNPSSATWVVKVTVAFGDSDTMTYTVPPTDTTQCKGGPGGEYCAVSTLSETVVQRIVQE